MYHLASSLLNPFLCFYLLTAGAMVLAWWRWKEARKALLCVLVPFAALTLAAWPPVAFLMQGSLEWAYPPRRDRPADTEAIVVLGGAMHRPKPGEEHWELGEDSLYRCLLAGELYAKGPAIPIVVSGGKVVADEAGPTLAEGMRQFLLKHGVAEGDILVEDASSNTYENAVESARMLRQRHLRHVILVTDATHLWRAERCFRKQGVNITPRGCSYQARHFTPSVMNFLPSENAAASVRRSVHEWVGMAWYWWRDRV